MKFRLESGFYFGENPTKKQWIKKYPCLEKYEIETAVHGYGTERQFIAAYITINTLEEFLELSKELGVAAAIEDTTIYILDTEIPTLYLDE